jgi:hypothetical protein
MKFKLKVEIIKINQKEYFLKIRENSRKNSQNSIAVKIQ